MAPLPLYNSSKNHHPFGMLMPGRSYSSTTYKYGFNGQEKDDEVYGAGNLNTAMFWEYDTRLGRRWNIDPKSTIGISVYATLSNNPIWLRDPLGDTTYNFTAKSAGKEYTYSEMTDLDKIGQKGMLNGVFKGKKFSEEFNFADPVNDPKNIQDGVYIKARYVTSEEVRKTLDVADVSNEKNNGLIDGPFYLLNHSNSRKNDGKTDFAVTGDIIAKTSGAMSTIFVIRSGNKLTGHNENNFGNFLWGAASSKLSVPNFIAVLGAHINNYFTDPANWDKKWYKKEFDSKDDQYSIHLGFQWSNGNK